MKRSRKNLKLDPNKVYKRIGQAVVILGFHAMLSAMFVFGFLQNTIY